MNIRLRTEMPIPPRIVLRSALNIDGITRDATGIALPGCAVRLFRTDADVIKDRSISNLASQYTVTPYDFTAQYVVSFKEGTADTTLVWSDTTYVTSDLSGEVSGVTADNLFGI